MKKILSIFLCVCLILSSFTIAFADSSTENEMIPGEESSVQISYDEYINLYAKANHMSVSKAIALDKKDTQTKLNKINSSDKNSNLESINASTSSTARYWKASKTFTYSGNSNFKAKSEATIKLVGAGSMYSISAVTAVWTVGASGSYTWQWNQLSAWSSGMTGSKVDIGGSGVFTITTPFSGGLGMTIDGFTVSGTAGATRTYTSNSMQMSWTWWNSSGQ